VANSTLQKLSDCQCQWPYGQDRTPCDLKDPRLIGIPLLEIRAPPTGFLVPSTFLAALNRLLHVATIAFRPRLPMSPWRSLGTPRFDITSPWSSGFYPLPPRRDYQASSALSHQYYPWIGHPLHPARFSGSPYRARFYGASCSFKLQCRRASLGKTHYLPISRPASRRFDSPDIRSRSSTPARPSPQRHIAGSLFATYTGSASCFLQTAHFWRFE
jgi:hypothetical protein